MKKIEYKILDTGYFLAKREMQELGQDGWKLAHIYKDDFIFMREKETENIIHANEDEESSSLQKCQERFKQRKLGKEEISNEEIMDLSLKEKKKSVAKRKGRPPGSKNKKVK